MSCDQPTITSWTNAIEAIQGQPAISILTDKFSGFPETNPQLLGHTQATPGAYQVDE